MQPVRHGSSGQRNTNRMEKISTKSKILKDSKVGIYIQKEPSPRNVCKHNERKQSSLGSCS